MSSVKISQLQNISGSLSNTDLIEVSQDIGGGLYTSSKATMEQVADFITDYQGLQFGGISGSWFQGNPKTYEVTLAIPYPDTSYVVTITGEDVRLWSILNKTVSGFVISSNSYVPFTGYVYWMTDELLTL
jgi:hypothetical protein